MTVSAVARLIPRPPARVDNRKQNAGDPTAVSFSSHNRYDTLGKTAINFHEQITETSTLQATISVSK